MLLRSALRDKSSHRYQQHCPIFMPPPPQSYAAATKWQSTPANTSKQAEQQEIKTTSARDPLLS